MADQFDVVFIGGGPGGYNGAIRAGQLGLKTACVDKRGTFGGTCLNVGCIPSKALLHASEMYEAARKDFAGLGIKVAGVELDLAAMLGQKDKSVRELTKGIEFLFKKNKVDGIVGEARLTAPGRIAVTLADGTLRELAAKHVVLATGSEVMPLPGVTIDEERVVSSTGALSLKAVPRRLMVVGGGYIGLEMGSVWRRLGAEVTVVEFLDRITPGLDGEIGKQFQRVLGRQGMQFRLGTKVVAAEKAGAGLKVTLEPAAGGQAEVVETDVVLVAIGRRPYTAGVGLDKAGIALDARGRIATNHWRTNVANHWAIGDCIEGPMLAHKAEDEGVAVAELIAGRAGHVNYDVIPAVVYTAPEVASVGRTEEELKAAGIAYKAGKFPFTANSRAKLNHQPDGLIKILADAKTDRVLGVHMMGAHVGEMIAEAAVAMEFGAASEDIARTCHPHPTMTEAIRQAAMGVEGWTMQM